MYRLFQQLTLLVSTVGELGEDTHHRKFRSSHTMTTFAVPRVVQKVGGVDVCTMYARVNKYSLQASFIVQSLFAQVRPPLLYATYYAQRLQSDLA
jgi:hypothetical protein